MMGIPGTNPVSGASPTGLLKRKKLQQRNDILQQRSDILLLFIEGVPKVKGLGEKIGTIKKSALESPCGA